MLNRYLSLSSCINALMLLNVCLYVIDIMLLMPYCYYSSMLCAINAFYVINSLLLMPYCYYSSMLYVLMPLCIILCVYIYIYIYVYTILYIYIYIYYCVYRYT